MKTYELPTPTAITSLSEMGEALEQWFNAYGSEDERLSIDYPLDWVEATCATNGWQLCEGPEWHDEDICTDGKHYLYIAEDREGRTIINVADND